MGRALYDSSPAARDVFAVADEALGFSISSLCFDGPEDDLKLTANTQPAILTVSVAVYRAAIEAGAPEPQFAAGHSLGEYSALVAAGVLELSDAVRLVRARGTFMQDAVPVGVGAMEVVLGLEDEKVEQACREAAQGDVCAPANYNGAGQVVIAGTAAAVARAGEIAKRLGAKRVIAIPVSAPFHTALMQPAAERMVELLEATSFRDPKFPVVSNSTAELDYTGEKARELLERQIASPVLWEQSVIKLDALGVKNWVEMGPGRVLAGLVRKTVKGATCQSVERPDDIVALFSAPAAGAEPASV